MCSNNRPDDAPMVAHMEVLAMFLDATGGEIRGKAHEGRVTLTGSKGAMGGADYQSARDFHRAPSERRSGLGFLLEVVPRVFSVFLCCHVPF